MSPSLDVAQDPPIGLQEGTIVRSVTAKPYMRGS
jgi:hypothetical protein